MSSKSKEHSCDCFKKIDLSWDLNVSKMSPEMVQVVFTFTCSGSMLHVVGLATEREQLPKHVEGNVPSNFLKSACT